MMRVLMTLLCATTILVTSGCGGIFKRDAPIQSSYALQLPDSIAEVQRVAGTSLQLLRFSISEKFATTQFVYRMDDVEYYGDYYNLYAAQPQGMIAEVTRAYLLESGPFMTVVPPGSLINTTHSLEANIIELYGDYRDRSAARAVLAITFYLSRDVQGETVVIHQETYRKSVPIADKDDPADMAKALNEALASILRDFATDAGSVVREPKTEDEGV